MRKVFGATMISTLLLGVASASSAFAHQGHRSCGEATRSFIVPVAQAGQLGQAVSSLAQQGGVGDEVAANHLALCEPAP